MLTNEQYITHFRDNWNMTIADDGNGGFLVNNTFSVTQQTETRKTFGGEKELPVWVIEVSEIIRGGYHEPDDYEIVELARERNLGLAFAKVAQLEFTETIQRGLEQLQEEMSEKEFMEFCERAEQELAKSDCEVCG
jgi:hypothetical protein